MSTFFIILAVVVAILLVLVVLAQNSKGGGLTESMSGASQLMGARRTTDWIEKATWVLVGSLFVLAIGINLTANPGDGGEQMKSSIIESTEAPAAPAQNAPAQPQPAAPQQ